MNTIQKLGSGIILIAFATAVLLPDRQTVPVINSIKNLFTGSLHTAIRG